MADPNNAPNSGKAISFSFGPSNEEPMRPQRADPDRPCPHEDFKVFADVNRITRSDEDPTVIAYTADLRVSCANCGEPFRWTGVQAGLSPKRPMVSPDELELRAPLRPASADPDFGLGIPGFAVTWKPAPDGGSSREVSETARSVRSWIAAAVEATDRWRLSDERLAEIRGDRLVATAVGSAAIGDLLAELDYSRAELAEARAQLAEIGQTEVEWGVDYGVLGVLHTSPAEFHTAEKAIKAQSPLMRRLAGQWHPASLERAASEQDAQPDVDADDEDGGGSG